MAPTDTRQAVIDAIAAVAPDTEPGEVSDDADFIDELELDSMDGMNVAVGIYERTGVDIAERDYARLRTLRDLVAYVQAALDSTN